MYPALTCQFCGKPIPGPTPWCTREKRKVLSDGRRVLLLVSRCYSRWQLKNFERLWLECIPKGGWRKS